MQLVEQRQELEARLQNSDGAHGQASGAAGLMGFSDELAGVKGHPALGGKQGR